MRIPEGHDGSEITGPAFNPDRTRLYVSSQRAPTPKPLSEIIPGATSADRIGGVTYEISGPFRDLAGAADTSTTSTTEASDDSNDDDDSNLPVVVGVGALVVGAAAGGMIAVRRRGPSS